MEKEKLDLYNKFKEVPKEARKEISGGRLKGKTDINPMWRIKKLTEEFGVCGIGWKTEIINKWIENGGGEERACFVEINLFIKKDEKWSDGICGIGGSSFVAKEKSGLYTNDECFKMAYTDAISVSCKALGMGADVYFEKNKTKYDAIPKQPTNTNLISDAQARQIFILSNSDTNLCKQVIQKYGYKKSAEIEIKNYDKICDDIQDAIPRRQG